MSGSDLCCTHICMFRVLCSSADGLRPLPCHLLPAALPQHHVSLQDVQAHRADGALPERRLPVLLLPNLAADLLQEIHPKALLCEHRGGEKLLFQASLHQHGGPCAYPGFGFASAPDDLFLLRADFTSVQKINQRVSEQCSQNVRPASPVFADLYRRLHLWNHPNQVRHESHFGWSADLYVLILCHHPFTFQPCAVWIRYSADQSSSPKTFNEPQELIKDVEKKSQSILNTQDECVLHQLLVFVICLWTIVLHFVALRHGCSPKHTHTHTHTHTLSHTQGLVNLISEADFLHSVFIFMKKCNVL